MMLVMLLVLLAMLGRGCCWGVFQESNSWSSCLGKSATVLVMLGGDAGGVAGDARCIAGDAGGVAGDAGGAGAVLQDKNSRSLCLENKANNQPQTSKAI